ncbi:glycosyltransferase family 4 protein [Mucilaginibacter boryungensis]|uniref:Glycosyltransferase family 4 protein n=1 Tax=Mucilaginibacter boryungensis TaxID=768480 RepID=A0ABR9XHV9_9SPHI|nr:glycosyltransferase family 4 protein [Mucilaginibacter boryungensis]MBE9666821.1 glycosyltransferase family 4 protein [Mucilaginibacter boryungensis]
MKILIVHNDLRVYWKRRLIYLRKFLDAKGIDLYAVELFGKGSPYDFDLYSKKEAWWDCLFPDKSNDQLTKYQIKDRIFSKLNELQPDIVIAGSIVFYAGALSLQWAKANKKKFIMFDDAKVSDVKRNFLVQTIKNLITRQIDALWLPSKNYEEGYAGILNKNKIHFFYGYDCIDNDQFKFKGERVFNKQTIVCVARLVPIKNIENLLKAWRAVEEINSNYRLIIIGDGPLAQDLKDIKESLQHKTVDFVGAIENEKVLEYLHKSDALVLPSFAESWGLVVNEAMAAGLPVLLSNKVNAANTLLKEGVNGYSFHPSNVVEMQQKILSFIGLSESAKKEMSDNSLKIIGTMDFENMGQQLISTLNKLALQPYNRPGLLARLIINLWYGRYNTAGWDKKEDWNDKRLFR